MMVEAVFYKGKVININLPTHVDLEVRETRRIFKEHRSGGTKPATLETGLRVTVPTFVTAGNIVRVDTRTGEYTERVS